MSKRTYITSLTAINNSNIVTVNDGTDLTNISPGDDLRIDGLPGEAVKAITATQIILERPWPLVNKTNVKGINVPTADDFREATKLLRDATVLTASNMSAVNDWTTQMGTVEFTDPAEPTVTYTVKTIRQLEQDAIVIIGSAVEDANRAEAARDAAIAAQNQAETHKNTAGVSAGNAATKASEAATSASTASTAATTATTKAAEAVVSANSALSEADRAEVEANKAMMAVTALYATTEAQFEANREQNRKLFAASGYESFGNHYNAFSWVPINEGLWIDPAETVNGLILGKSPTPAPMGKSKSRLPILNVAGVLSTLENINSQASQNIIKFPQAPDGKTTYNKATGVRTVHVSASDAFAAQAADPTNVEVVINRVDMWGFEAWLEEVNATNPYIYPNGLIQSQAETMDGAATSASARPESYYAVFDGDTGSKGKGLNFFTLTDAQKKKVLGNHKNNLYYLDDGRLVQWRLRQRTIAGAGNGDWVAIDTTARDALNFTTKSRVQSQGTLDSVAPYTDSFITDYVSNSTGVMFKEDIGTFGTRGVNTGAGINGECYFLVGGTVNRLNQGAYHPSFNPSGAGKWRDVLTGGQQYPWYATSAAISNSSAFDPDRIASGFSPSGSISSAQSGRPDGRYYDAIYADGQGGVCRDMRYSAYGVDLVDFAEADQRVKNGIYRGFEFGRITRVISFVTSSSETNSDYGRVPMTRAEALRVCELIGLPTTGATLFPQAKMAVSLYNPNNGKVIHSSAILAAQGNSNFGTYLDPANPSAIWLGFDQKVVENSLSGNQVLTVAGDAGTANSNIFCSSGQTLYAIVTTLDKVSVGGSFLQTDVIGNPANILATPALANGWQGSWIGTGQGSGVATIPLSRKYVGYEGGLKPTYTLNNGSTWSSTVSVVDTVTDSLEVGLNDNLISIVTYQAFAKQTEPAENAVVYGKQSGVGKVFFNFYHSAATGCLLTESMLDKVILGTPAGRAQDSVIMYNPFLYLDGASTGKLVNAGVGYEHSHYPTSITNSNGSFGSKALNYNVNINQQAFIQYAYTELKHNGTNWGDDGKVAIVDNQSSKMDLNGNTVLVGTAKLKEPIGWLKIKV